MTSVALQHKDKIIEAISAGKILREIAEEYGVTKQALSQVLRNDPEYRDAIETRWELRLDEGLREMEQAESLDAVRAGEAKLRRVEWRAERECSHRWGTKQQVDVSVSVRVEERLERDLGQVIDQLVAPAPQSLDSNADMSQDSNTLDAQQPHDDEGTGVGV